MTYNNNCINITITQDPDAVVSISESSASNSGLNLAELDSRYQPKGDYVLRSELGDTNNSNSTDVANAILFLLSKDTQLIDSSISKPVGSKNKVFQQYVQNYPYSMIDITDVDSGNIIKLTDDGQLVLPQLAGSYHYNVLLNIGNINLSLGELWVDAYNLPVINMDSNSMLIFDYGADESSKKINLGEYKQSSLCIAMSDSLAEATQINISEEELEISSYYQQVTISIKDQESQTLDQISKASIVPKYTGTASHSIWDLTRNGETFTFGVPVSGTYYYFNISKYVYETVHLEAGDNYSIVSGDLYVDGVRLNATNDNIRYPLFYYVEAD